MFQHLLIATDGYDLSEKAVREGCRLAKALGARVTLVNIRAAYGAVMLLNYPYPTYMLPDKDEFDAQGKAHAETVLKRGVALAAELGVSAETMVREHELPWRGILDAAEASAADLLVMASHGRGGIGAVILGSETQKVLTHSKMPVLVVR